LRPRPDSAQGRVVAYDTIERLREQSDQPSLEGVFTSFTEADTRRDLADRILGAMRA
jgi:hypothetical protein